jgi:HSP20 family protein
MDMKSLMPWRRNERTLPATRSYEEMGSPFLSLHREMNRVFDDFFRGFNLPSSSAFPGFNPGWPSVEVSEDEKSLKVCAELPGMDEKDVELTLHDGMLTLKGEKKSENETNGYSERWHGRFERSIPLGPDVDLEKVDAGFKNGVLTVTIQKKPEAMSKVKRIPIRT